jgi:vacuolar protein sorting-associated protein 45
MRSQKSLFSNLRQNTAVVLVLDRKDDPVTPLLLQWTYQAMTHDHLTITNNRVEIAKGAEKKEQLVLSEQDPFYRENMYKNFGDLGIAIKDLVDQYKEKMQINQNITSIEDMKNFVEQYPEFKKLSGNVSKHVKIVEELQRYIQRRQLLTVSELEQELSSHHGHADALNKVKQLLDDSHISGEDALRIVLLYSLRYESAANNELSSLVNALASKKNLSPSVLAIFKQLRDYAGEKRRSMDIDLFKNKNLLDIARGQIKRGLMGVTNIYSQNESLVKRVLTDLQAGTLSDVAFPYVDPPAAKERPTEVILFIAGGVCYEESVAVYEFNQRNTGINVVLGGNVIHNYKSFIEDVMEYR